MSTVIEHASLGLMETTLWPTDPRRVPLGGEAFALHLPARSATTAPPVVVVHGYRGLAVEYGPLAERLAARRDVWVPELITSGAGLSAVHALLERVTKEAGGGPVDVVASSMGGFVAFSWSAARPSSVRGMTMLAPAAVPLQASWRIPGVTRLIGLRKVLDADERNWEQSLLTASADDFMAADTDHHLRIPSAWRQAVLDAQVSGVGTATAAGRIHARQQIVRALMATLRGRGMARLLGRVTAPVLWLHGEPDNRVPFAPSREAARLLPSCEFEQLDGVGHLIHLECPDLVADRVSR